MTAFSLTALAAPHAVGVCAGCKDDIAVVDGYCPACAELNAAYEARLRARLEAFAAAELGRAEQVDAREQVRQAVAEEAAPDGLGAAPAGRGDCAARAVEDLAEALAEMPRAVALAAAGLFLAGFWGLVAWALFGR